MFTFLKVEKYFFFSNWYIIYHLMYLNCVVVFPGPKIKKSNFEIEVRWVFPKKKKKKKKKKNDAHSSSRNS